MSWPQRSPELTSYDFFLFSYVKDLVFVPPLQRDLAELRGHITRAVNTKDRAMLGRVCQELDYRCNVYHVTKGSHIEYLQGL